MFESTGGIKTKETLGFQSNPKQAFSDKNVRLLASHQNSVKSLRIKISAYYQGLTQNPLQEKSDCFSWS